MKQHAQTSKPSSDGLSGKWKQHVGSAKIVWAKLTHDELLESEGQADRLAGMVQERYGISREKADKQVGNFLYQFKL